MKIAVLAGDGIGPEIVGQAVRVLEALRSDGLKLELEPAPIGGAGYDTAGDPLPKATLELAHSADAVLLGQRLITGAVEANNLLILYPSSEDGAIEAYLIRHGRLAGQRRSPANADDLACDLGELVALARTLPAPPLRVGREEVDQINIIARWIHQHSDDEARAFFSLPRELENVEVMDEFINGVVMTATSARAEEAEAVEQVEESEEIQE